jgi:di/tricarboxylate transporter
MTLEIALLLVILVSSMVLFARETFSADVVGLGVLLALVLADLVPAERAFAGFGSDAVIMILGLLIMTAALLRTGVVDVAGRLILRRTGTSPEGLLAVVMLSVASLSAFISNTAATAFFLPIVLGIASRAKVSPSKLLMPLAFASILTSSVTVVSSSTNIVASGLLVQKGMAPLGMFEMAPVGVPIAVVGLLYMFTLGRRLLPSRSEPPDPRDEFGLRPYLTEVLVPDGSTWVGRTLAETGFGTELDLQVLRIIREQGRYLAPRASMRIESGDVVLVEGRREDVLKVKDVAGIEIKADAELADPSLEAEDVRLVEAIVMPRSPLIGRTLKGHRFRDHYGLQVLAINREDESIRQKLGDVHIRLGDMLLVQGHRDELSAVEESGVFRVVGRVDEARPNLARAWPAIAIFAGSLLLATTKLLPLPVAALLGALLTFVTRCITPQEAYREVEWKAIVLIGSMLALGVAMDETGTASYLAAALARGLGDLDPRFALGALFLATILLTQPMSNQAAVIVLIPVAVEVARALSLDARPFAMSVTIAASCSYLTPLEPSCLMVYAPGRYRFVDFFKVGSVLTLLIFSVAMSMIPLVWPLHVAARP